MAWHGSGGSSVNISTNNGSGSGNSSRDSGIDLDTMERGFYSYISCSIIFGTTLNLWMLTALVTSPEMRTKLRNKLLCMLLLNNIIKTTVVSGAKLAKVVAIFRRRLYYNCSFATFARVSNYIVLWVENTFLIIFLIRYLVVLVNRGPITNIRYPRIKRVGTILILVCPWIIDLVLVPSVIAYHSHMRVGPLTDGCLVITTYAYKVVRVFGTVIPFFLKLALLAAILVFYYRWRSKDGAATSSYLIGGLPQAQIDDVKGYVAICILSSLTQAGAVAISIGNLQFQNTLQRFIYIHTVWALVEFRGVVMPLCFLFFSDLRDRLKTWRPCRHGTGAGDINNFIVRYEDKEIDQY